MPGVLGKSAVAGVRKRQRFLWLCLWTSVVIPSMPRCGSHRISSGPLSKNFAQAAFAPGGTIHSDGYGSYVPALEGYTHEHKLYDPNSGLLHWLHIVISNAKRLSWVLTMACPRSTSKPTLTNIASALAAVILAHAFWSAWP